jgi:hypothetical protein
VESQSSVVPSHISGGMSVAGALQRGGLPAGAATVTGRPRRRAVAARSTIQTRTRCSAIWFPAAPMLLKTVVAALPLNAAVAQVGAGGRARCRSGNGALAGQ